MFDIGFPELVLVSIVALLVIGPDKLPETVRTVALWVGRIKRSFANIKQEIENEIGADEIRRQLHNESIMQQLDEAKEQINSIAKEADESLSELKEAATITERDLSADGQESQTTTSTKEIEQDNNTEDDGRKHSESGG